MCNYPFRLYETGLLRVHHYLGSWEQYSAREDVRRNRDKFDVSAFVNFGTDYQLQGWLKRFVETVGVEKSKLLLQHSGMIDVGKSYDLPLIDRPDYGYIKVELPKDSDGSTSTADQNQEPKNQQQPKEEIQDAETQDLLYYYDNGKLTEVKEADTGKFIPLDDRRLKVNADKKD